MIIRSPIDNWAFKHQIPVFYDALEAISKVNPGLGILAAYGKIIPEPVINFFPKGILNVHPSLLPKFRGASPIQAAIVSGEKETGATIIKLDSQIDHGPVLSQFKEQILEADTTGSLRKRLFERASEFLIRLIPNYLKGKINLREQNDDQATFTTLIKKEDGLIPPQYIAAALDGNIVKEDWAIKFIKHYSLVPSTNSLERFIRAMDPWPGAWTLVNLNPKSEIRNPKRLKILKAHLEELVPSAYRLVPDLVQLEGKNPVSWEEFKLGYPNFKFAG